jgi:hypothetical protein
VVRRKHQGNIGRITPGGTVTEFAIPTANSGPQEIATGPDGNLWFTENLADKVGRITPTGTVTEFRIPTANSHPQGIAAGPDGNLWFTEGGGDTIGRIGTGVSYTGRAYGASSSLFGGTPMFLGDTGEISTTTASDTPKIVTNVPGPPVSAQALSADVQTAAGTPSGSSATASGTNVNINIPGVPAIHADLLKSSSRSTCTAAPVGNAEITNLTIGGNPVTVSSSPNSSISLGLLGSLTVNEQTPLSGGLRVNALHVSVPGVADVVLASSRSDIHNC